MQSTAARRYPLAGNPIQSNRDLFERAETPDPHSAYVPPDNLSFLARPFKMERPLLTFDGRKGPEDFEKFVRTFEFYVESRGVQALSMKLVETWLERTPLMVYQQFLRDHPNGTFDQFKEILRRSFGKPLDARRAVHKLQTIQWKEDQPLVDLAAEVHELHFLAHPTISVEDRDSYAGDTFIRCLPEKWQMKLRSQGGSTLTEYLEQSLELQNKEWHKTELQTGRSFAEGGTRRVEDSEDDAASQGPGAYQSAGATSSSFGRKPPRCYFCRKEGHIRSQCTGYAKWLEEIEAEEKEDPGTAACVASAAHGYGGASDSIVDYCAGRIGGISKITQGRKVQMPTTVSAT